MEGGLVGDFKAKSLAQVMVRDAELPALRRLRLGPSPEAREKISHNNRKRLAIMQAASAGLMGPPGLPQLMADGARSSNSGMLGSASCPTLLPVSDRARVQETDINASVPMSSRSSGSAGGEL